MVKLMNRRTSPGRRAPGKTAHPPAGDTSTQTPKRTDDPTPPMPPRPRDLTQSKFAEDVFDFVENEPQELLFEGEPEDLYRAVDNLKNGWTERALDITDAAICRWSSIVHARSRDLEGIAEMNRLIRRLQVLLPADESGSQSLDVERFYNRWNGVATVLEVRFNALVRHDLEVIQTRQYMPELRKIMLESKDEVTAKSLLEELGISKVRLSQVLSLAETVGLIERRKQGREQFVKAAGPWKAAALATLQKDVQKAGEALTNPTITAEFQDIIILAANQAYFPANEPRPFSHRNVCITAGIDPANVPGEFATPIHFARVPFSFPISGAKNFG